jgi:hypothetical protein
MRSTDRDHATLARFGAFVPDSATPQAVPCSNGLVAVVTRTATGLYTLIFDPRIVPVHVEAGAYVIGDRTVTIGSLAPGQFNVVKAISGAAENGPWSFVMMAKDTRS